MTRLFRTVVARVLPALALGASVSTLTTARASAQTPPTVTLTRLACGTNAAPTNVGLRFSDTYAFSGVMVQLTYSCYLVRHNDDS